MEGQKCARWAGMRIRAMATAVAVLLSACGGGGSNEADMAGSSGPSAEGVYSGTLTGSAVATNFSTLVLEDGQIWSIYGNLAGGVLHVYGLIQGQGTSRDGAFNASDVRDFGFTPAVAGSLSASYVVGQSIAGTLTMGSGSVNFNGAMPAASNYNYNAAASLADVAGNWTMASTSGDTVTIDIASSGAFTGSGNTGCQLSGSLTPRPSGKRVFNVQMRFGGSPCALPGQSVSGIALYSSPAGGGTQLTVAIVDGTRTIGTVAFGQR